MSTTVHGSEDKVTPQLVRDIRISLLILAAVILFACIGLAFDGNWPKLLRVALAFATYAGTLYGAARRGRTGAGGFVVAGALAGLVSAVVRPELDAALLPVSIAGGIVFSLVHRFGATRWRAGLAESAAGTIR